MRASRFLQALLWLGTFSCAGIPPPPPSARHVVPLVSEVHLGQLKQLTFGGENAEAYWSFGGQQLSLQVRKPSEGCDSIYRMEVAEERPALHRISSGEGATTCAHFLPGDTEVVYASTHLEGKQCPPKPDMSQGYVWALYPSYDIFRANADGSNLRRLTTTEGYDAEATVCSKDGSIIFTSVRDGDLELYRMDSDGSNVKRLTHAPGYDGGAFFNSDCSKIVWRAARPRKGGPLEEYQALLAKGLVRPTRLEIYVANADGTDAVQLTYLEAASFAPYFFPDGKRVIFSSNHGDAKGREFNLWAVNIDGTQLEQITYAKGFDGFPMFSPDGKWLAFSSNRETPEGRTDTDVFIGRWIAEPKGALTATPADRVMADATWLADSARQGRGVGTTGLIAAGRYLEQRFKALGLAPSADTGTEGSYRQAFPVATQLERTAATALTVSGSPLPAEAVVPLGYSARTKVQGALVLAGYGIVAPVLSVRDYEGKNVKGKVVVVRRFTPEGAPFAETQAQRRFGDLRHKAWVAREHGAIGLVVVDAPLAPAGAGKDWKPPQEAPILSPTPEGYGDAGLPVVFVKRSAFEPHLRALEKGARPSATLSVGLKANQTEAFNVVGLLEAGGDKLPGVVVVGAHYDHLGLGGKYSLTPDRSEPHLGADDNASGVAALLEVAAALKAKQASLRRDVLFIAFSGEESGVLGSTHFVRHWKGDPSQQAVAMLNMDMVGRLRENRLTVLGAESAKEWSDLISSACQQAAIECSASGDGYGPSDHTPFYAAKIPVLHFFTGAHSDYHKPSDSPDKLNGAGLAKIAQVVGTVALNAATTPGRLTLQQAPSPAPRGDLRSFNASLGTIPDYAGPPNGQKGVLLAGVRPGGGAEKGGMARGDILIRLGTHDIGSVEDLMYALNAAHPGETVKATVLRNGQSVVLEVTFQESKRR